MAAKLLHIARRGRFFYLIFDEPVRLGYNNSLSSKQRVLASPSALEAALKRIDENEGLIFSRPGDLGPAEGALPASSGRTLVSLRRS